LIFEEEEEADAEDVDEEVDPDDLIEELEETNEFNEFNDAGEAGNQPRCSWVYTYRFKDCWQRTLTHGNSSFSFPLSHMHVEFCSVFWCLLRQCGFLPTSCSGLAPLSLTGAGGAAPTTLGYLARPLSFRIKRVH